MANPADNLDSLVSILEEISRIASKIESKFSTLITAIKNIKVVNPAAGAAPGTGKSKKKTAAESDFEESASAASESFSNIERSIVEVSTKIQSMGSTIESATTSIIEFGSLFSQWEDDFGSLAEEISSSVPQIEGFGNELAKYGKIVESNSRGLIEYGSLASQWEDANKDITEFVSVVEDSFESAIVAVGKASEQVFPVASSVASGAKGKQSYGGEFAVDPSILEEFNNLFPMVGQAVSALGATVAGAASGFAAFAGALAAVPGVFMEVVNMVSQFVGALDPALMQQLSLAFSDLQATVGVALRPVIQAVIPIIKAWADTLLPLMQQLEPVIASLADKLMTLATIYITIAANVIAQLIPVIESIIPIFDDLAEILMILLPVVIFTFDLLGRTLNFVIGIFHSFMVGIKMITVVLLEAAAWITSWFSKSKAESIKGASKAVQESMGRSLQAQADAFGRAFGPSVRANQGEKGGAAGLAAKSASYAGIADLGKNMMQAAFGSGTKGNEVRMVNGIEKMAEGIGEMAKWMGGQAKENKKLAGVRN